GMLSDLQSNVDGTVWTATLTPNTDVESSLNAIKLTGNYTDVAGNVGSIIISNNYSIDTLPPTGLLGAAEIVIDADNDGIIDIEEKGTSNQTDVVIELGAGIEVGDILTLTSNTGQTIAPITITQS